MVSLTVMMFFMGALPMEALLISANTSANRLALEARFSSAGGVEIKVPSGSGSNYDAAYGLTNTGSHKCDILYVRREDYAGYSSTAGDQCYANNHCRYVYVNGLTGGCGSGSDVQFGEFVSISNLGTLEDGNYLTSFSRNGHWSPSALTGPSFSVASGSVVGDPHVVNMDGVKFDIKADGRHVFVQIPRFADASHATLLRVDATVEHVNKYCRDRQHMYVTALSMAGTWTDGLPKLLFTPGVGEQNTTLLVNGQSPVDAFKGFPGTKVTLEGPSVRLNLGETSLRVTKVYLKRGMSYLNFDIKGLKNVVDVGGLLGHDDHTKAATDAGDCISDKALDTSRESLESRPVGGSTIQAS